MTDLIDILDLSGGIF